MIETSKLKWLTKRGYRPITDEVIHELMAQDERAMPYSFDELKQMFQYYRRYGKMIMPYSIGYLQKMPLRKLKQCHWRNIRRFEFDETVIGKCIKRVQRLLGWR